MPVCPCPSLCYSRILNSREIRLMLWSIKFTRTLLPFKISWKLANFCPLPLWALFWRISKRYLKKWPEEHKSLWVCPLWLGLENSKTDRKWPLIKKKRILPLKMNSSINVPWNCWRKKWQSIYLFARLKTSSLICPRYPLCLLWLEVNWIFYPISLQIK